MKLTNERWVLFLVFVLCFGTRLFIAFQTPYVDYDSYFTLREIEHIKETGLPLSVDELSYGGRETPHMPVFEYVLAFFNIMAPLNLVVKIIPNMFASLLVVVVYIISKKITKSVNAALFTAFISGFVPIFFSQTVNAISVYSGIIPLMFFLVYLLMNLTHEKGHVFTFLVLFLVLSLAHPSAFILMLGFLIYLMIGRIENIRINRAETEVILFSTALLVFLQFLIYKKALLFHGPLLVWQNIPSSILKLAFSNITVLESIYKIGIIPFIFGIFIIYKYMFRQKERTTYLLMSLALAAALLLWIKVIEPDVGLVFLGIILVLLFSRFYTMFFSYLSKTKAFRLKKYFVMLFLILFLITSVIPSVTQAMDSLEDVPSEDIISAMVWLKKNTPPNSVVLASLKEGHLITAIAERKNLFDKNFLMISDVEQRLEDSGKIYTTQFKTLAIGLLNKYNIKYILISPNTKLAYNIDYLRYADKTCFEKVYNSNSTLIYKSLCEMKE